MRKFALFFRNKLGFARVALNQSYIIRISVRARCSLSQLLVPKHDKRPWQCKDYPRKQSGENIPGSDAPLMGQQKTFGLQQSSRHGLLDNLCERFIQKLGM